MKTRHLALLVTFSTVTSITAFAGEFVPTGVIDMIPTSMSDDASIVVGNGVFGAPNLYYTEADGVEVIGAGCASGLPAISGDGNTVLGCHVDQNGNENAAKWLGGSDWLDLGSEAGAVPCGTLLSGAWAVNQNGTIGTGLLWRAQVCRANAGTWDLINGGPATVLPTLISGPASRANAINADGRVIVGWHDQITGERTATRWIDTVPEFILTRDGQLNGEAHAVSADGRSIVGERYNLGREGWIWRPKTGVTPIGPVVAAGASDAPQVSEKASFIPLDVSDDGRIAVGFVQKGFSTRAFIWRSGFGLAYLDAFLATRGIPLPSGWFLNVASIISPDGNTIYGWGFNENDLIEMYKVDLTD